MESGTRRGHGGLDFWQHSLKIGMGEKSESQKLSRVSRFFLLVSDNVSIIVSGNENISVLEFLALFIFWCKLKSGLT